MRRAREPSGLADAVQAKLARHHRLIATRAHLLELTGDTAAAAASYREAARHATGVPERRYLSAQAQRLSAGS